jgi:hypothetical protein
MTAKACHLHVVVDRAPRYVPARLDADPIDDWPEPNESILAVQSGLIHVRQWSGPISRDTKRHGRLR